MSEFSEKLESYLGRNGHNTASFAKLCGIERTVFYKYEKGKRLPQNLETVEEIADKLLLAVDEKMELIRLWNMERIGKEAFLQREGVKELLENLNEYTSFHMDSSQFVINCGISDDKTVYIAKSEIELQMYIRNILKYEALKEKFEVRMCMQPRYHFLLEALLEYSEYPALSVTQLVCFHKQKDTIVNNLKYLKEILPMAFCLPDYKLKVYYEHAEHHINSMSVLPNIILTGEFVILFSYGGKEGIIYREREIYGFYSELYENMSKQCKCISTNCGTVEEYMNSIMNKNFMYFINQNPCFGIGFTREFLDKMLIQEIPDRDALIENIISDIERRTVEYEKHACEAFFTKKGVVQFMKTGRDNEYPPELYRQLTEAESRELIQSLCDSRTLFYVHNRLFDDMKFHYESDVIIHIEIGGGVIFQKPDGQFRRKFVTLEESSINEMFVDFFENLDKMQYIKSEEETIEYLRSLL
ncbi:helix-turn-helix domain-containing protein [Anaerocolumna xylanovorans]|uniref:Uncharacterized protein n=1 Tax=Anaerocolumna xylanovorans DSM 12503 TaxID=1121345 RepID=A0A1M7YHG9_9FIRM|nr:helix-turn-helix transcriptional regulator [Anaerocolumna xylanovorans]SHO52087.1 hypothetical protein SAMN02745217_03498 [Anaerocolumna xylanovorans DSM 12503]